MKYANEINGVITVFEKLPEPYIPKKGGTEIGLKYSVTKQEANGFYQLIEPVKGQYQTLGEIYFSVDDNFFTYRKIDKTPEEIAEYELSLVPQEITLRQLRLQMLEDSISNDTILLLINSIPDADQKERTLIEWTYATTFYRSNPDIILMWSYLGYTETMLNEFFISANNQ